MTAIEREAAVAPRRLPMGVIVGVGAAWFIAIAASVAGKADLLHHDVLIEGDLPIAVAVVLFLLAWQVMIAAMMLPTTFPLMKMFVIASAKQERPRAVLVAFLGGYVVLWSAFGLAAFVLDIGVHQLVDSLSWLHDRPWVIAGGVLVLAGLFQWSELKDRCLTECRHPAMWMLRRYRRGMVEAFRLGRDHGLFCLGCCWALMLLMFAAGVANIIWMAALTALMAYEKIGRHGERVARAVGVALAIWGIVVMLQPAWLPGAIAGAA